MKFFAVVMSLPDIEERIKEIINGVARDLDYMIHEASVLLRGENSKIYVKIDHLNGISHNDCAAFSSELSKRLDDDNILPNYSLEVSSPGLKRELRGLGDFRRFKDSHVKIIYNNDEGRSVYKGIIADIGEDYIELSIGNDIIKLNIDRVIKANLDFF